MKQLLLQAVIMGIVAAALVWFLEDFNRRKLVADWQGFIEGWTSGTGGQQHG